MTFDEVPKYRLGIETSIKKYPYKIPVLCLVSPIASNRAEANGVSFRNVLFTDERQFALYVSSIPQCGIVYQRYSRRVSGPLRTFIRENFTLMLDHARPHVANCVQEYLETIEIWIFRRPAPDLNPIEDAHDELDKTVRVL